MAQEASENDTPSLAFPYAVRRLIWGAGFTNTDELAWVDDDALLALGLDADRLRRIRQEVPYLGGPICPTCDQVRPGHR